ncbi:hypothetical protein [Roseivirga pacifica]|uniref:hypothetical protein n=1 Tax=Roseivirga pacifica TaxID=1267423 RepID=UPI003BB0A24E
MESLEIAYYEIGVSIYKYQLGARKPSRLEFIEKGKQWILEQKAIICDIIKSPKVKAIIEESDEKNTEQNIRDLVDILVSLKLGVPPFALAKLILHLGSNWFCE